MPDAFIHDSAVLTSTRDGVLTITLNRAGKMNALTHDMYMSIISIIQQAGQDDAVRVVFLRGQESCFSAGNDFKLFGHRKPGAKSAGIQLLEKLACFEKPVVAAVTGAAVGIGSTLLLHCDLVYASPETRFRMPFVPLGLVPEGASTLLLPQLIGHQHAAKILMIGDFFSATEAFDIGIVTEVIPLETIFDHAQSTAQQLAKQPCRALLETKRLMKSQSLDNILEAIDSERQVLDELVISKESKAALKTAMSPGDGSE